MKYNLSTPTMKEVYHTVLEWRNKDHLLISEEERAEVNAATSVSHPFAAGRTAMHMRMTPDVGMVMSTVGRPGEDAAFDWDVMYLPNYGDNLAVTRAGGHGNNIPKQTEHPDEAWEFCKFMGTTPGQTYMARTKLGVPNYKADPELRRMYEDKVIPHDQALIGSVSDRGGYGDHFRHNTSDECLYFMQEEMDLVYATPYEEADSILDETLERVEEELNGMVKYGDELPFPDVEFPMPPG